MHTHATAQPSSPTPDEQERLNRRRDELFDEYASGLDAPPAGYDPATDDEEGDE